MSVNEYSNCVGVVLAGGNSSRMGRDKAMLDFNGQILLQHQVNLLLEVCQRVVVSGNYAGFECIADNETDAGPLAGLQAIAHAMPCAALLVIPVDMPYLNAPVLSGLMDQPCNGFYNHEPLPAYFHRSKDVLLALKQLQQQGIWPTSIWRLHQQLNSKSVQCDDDLRLRNFNTPEQWHARNEITD